MEDRESLHFVKREAVRKMREEQAGQPRWHCSVAITMTSRDGTDFCGRIGMACPCDSQEDGWKKAVGWLRNGKRIERNYMLHTWEIKVRFF